MMVCVGLVYWMITQNLECTFSKDDLSWLLFRMPCRPLRGPTGAPKHTDEGIYRTDHSSTRKHIQRLGIQQVNSQYWKRWESVLSLNKQAAALTTWVPTHTGSAAWGNEQNSGQSCSVMVFWMVLTSTIRGCSMGCREKSWTAQRTARVRQKTQQQQAAGWEQWHCREWC